MMPGYRYHISVGVLEGDGGGGGQAVIVFFARYKYCMHVGRKILYGGLSCVPVYFSYNFFIEYGK